MKWRTCDTQKFFFDVLLRFYSPTSECLLFMWLWWIYSGKQQKKILSKWEMTKIFFTWNFLLDLPPTRHTKKNENNIFLSLLWRYGFFFARQMGNHFEKCWWVRVKEFLKSERQKLRNFCSISFFVGLMSCLNFKKCQKLLGKFFKNIRKIFQNY